MPAPCPQLLVSVRNASEAHQAVLGGADVLDFKNPARGSLGPVDAETIASACGRLRELTAAPLPTVSAALGELAEISFSRLPPEVRYVKLGLSGMRTRPDWRDIWRSTRDRFGRLNSAEVKWVAVAYADDIRADAPPVEEVLREAAHAGCAGLLIDTFDKGSGRLLELLDLMALRKLGRAAHGSRLFFALAGRLRLDDIPLLADAAPDIVAVRSAACEGDDRIAEVSAARVAALREALRGNHRCSV
jgi:(5-formylfuran-3-yl)methyl phosphate synthase